MCCFNILQMKNFFQGIIFSEQFLCQLAVLLLVEVGVAERLDGGCEVNRLDVVLHVEMEGRGIVPESGFGENSVHPLPAVVVYAAHEIGGDTDLNTVKLRCFQYFIQRMGNQMLASACGRAAAGNLVCDAAHGEGVEQFL